MDDTHDRDDPQLLETLEEVLLLTHEPPRHVLEAGYAAFDWPTVDAELAEIVAEQMAAAGVRGGMDELSQRYEADNFALDLEVTVQAGLQRIVGSVEPAGQIPLEVHHAGGTIGTTTDAQGRFSVERLARGAARLICRPTHRGPVEVRWASP